MYEFTLGMFNLASPVDRLLGSCDVYSGLLSEPHTERSAVSGAAPLTALRSVRGSDETHPAGFFLPGDVIRSGQRSRGGAVDESRVLWPHRSAGILLHPSSLPGPFGVGDLGPVAYAWVDAL